MSKTSTQSKSIPPAPTWNDNDVCIAVIALSNISHPGGRAPVAAIKSLTCTVCVLTSACLLLASSDNFPSPGPLHQEALF